MAHRPSPTAAPDAFGTFGAETIIFRGHPVRRGFALLLEREISDDIDELVMIGHRPAVEQTALLDDEARPAVYGDLLDIERDNAAYDFANPDYRPRA